MMTAKARTIRAHVRASICYIDLNNFHTFWRDQTYITSQEKFSADTSRQFDKYPRKKFNHDSEHPGSENQNRHEDRDNLRDKCQRLLLD